MAEERSTERVDVQSETDRYPKCMGMIKNEVDYTSCRSGSSCDYIHR